MNATIINVKTVTLGATSVLTPRMNNEFRFNVTGDDYKSSRTLDNFGGAIEGISCVGLTLKRYHRSVSNAVEPLPS